MKRRLMIALVVVTACAASLVAAHGLVLLISDRPAVHAKPKCDDVFFCLEGWQFARAGSEGGEYWYCAETQSWILCTTGGSNCLCYYSETCPCPPQSGFTISEEEKKIMDELIRSKRGKP